MTCLPLKIQGGLLHLELHLVSSTSIPFLVIPIIISSGVRKSIKPPKLTNLTKKQLWAKVFEVQKLYNTLI